MDRPGGRARGLRPAEQRGRGGSRSGHPRLLPGEGTDSYEELLAELRAEKAARLAAEERLRVAEAARLEERRDAEAARQVVEDIRIAQVALPQSMYVLDTAPPPSTLQCVLAGVQLQMGGRVEFGGSSSVCYACVFEGQPAVVKCAAINTRTMEHSDLRPEADTLRLLNDAHCPAVPRLLAQGDPVNDALPFLVIAPRGEPLCMFATRTADPRALAADVAPAAARSPSLPGPSSAANSSAAQPAAACAAALASRALVSPERRATHSEEEAAADMETGDA